ncbi:MAG: RNA-binding transcriptional accessory protein [Flavobacteriales bacterium]|nr:RNA-binding transcriptional accessory protein [Flavobacteriales bacterium]MCB9335989.1 RNA-binding transcriptional accessory protein [Flavobacteriales bacterium]
MFPSLISKNINLPEKNVKAVIDLLEGGATVPFIARYRKDMTGGMEDINVFEVQKQLAKFKELEKRKTHICSVIEEQGKLSSELKTKIDDCWDEKVLEDIYLPYKPKRQTKAEVARQNGLEGLAGFIMKQEQQNLGSIIDRFIKGNIKTEEEAIDGAKDIIAEWISERQNTRDRIRRIFYYEGELFSKLKKGKEQEAEKYELYFDFSQKVMQAPSHRVLAILRGTEEGFLSSGIKVDKDKILDSMNQYFVKGHGEASEIVEQAVKDAYQRLIKPAIENELLKEIKLKADQEAIKVFAQNIRQLLMVPPLGSKNILAIDPGFKTGCKVVCLDKQGNLKHNETIFPHPPQNQMSAAMSKISSLCNSYKIDAIAIGNGTAGRETEQMMKKIRFSQPVEVYTVNESGASIYSASNIGREEFPDYDVTVRGSVSIGRRLMDPLAELVKIEPKSIGVGQYQHDVDQNLLKTELDHVVESCVNQVGVNVNTASKYLLQYVAGVGPVLAENIVNYRTENGPFETREEIKKVPRMGAKVFEQCAGFLRVKGKNVLDNTSVHPEQYKAVESIAKSLNKKVEELIDDENIINTKLDEKLVNEVGKLTLQDILKELAKPGFDPRKKIRKFNFDDTLKTINDVREGMIVPGLVTNLTNFGAFVDIGIKENGLVHISHITDRFISSPMEELDLNDYVKVKVISVDIAKKRIGLSIKDAKLG